MSETFPEYLVYLERTKYFLKWSDRLFSPPDFLLFFLRDGIFSPHIIDSRKFAKDFSRIYR
ncbi:MAG: hypothetical protein F6K22_14870 [Okeania sp. SIO2F4]|uniref:hypothetical protein n=1 Tax=Okeania sp. SIO2F4 TaxID=2607790 RepID=UPI0014291FDB|nr:hypothetical protein [Okeania sp. SIO2F4]NES04005.1 hypothetical protein [Okeania sp. SIO2F4]